MFPKLVKDSHILDNIVLLFSIFFFLAIPRGHNVLSNFLCKAKILNFDVFIFNNISPFDRWYIFTLNFYSVTFHIFIHLRYQNFSCMIMRITVQINFS